MTEDRMQETVPCSCFLAEVRIVQGAKIVNERVLLHKPPTGGGGSADYAKTKAAGLVAQGESFQHLHKAFDVGGMIEGADEA
jgi:hypothetical protein